MFANVKPSDMNMIVTEEGMVNVVPVFLRAPASHPIGGEISFDDDIKKEDFIVLLKILGVEPNHGNGKPYTDYHAFNARSRNVFKNHYIYQFRIVSSFAERHLFNTIDQKTYDHYPPQKLNIVDRLWSFIEKQKKLYSWNMIDLKTEKAHSRIAGLYHGDGHWAYESLSFGFMVESDYYGVYRIWSHPWLVHK